MISADEIHRAQLREPGNELFDGREVALVGHKIARERDHVRLKLLDFFDKLHAVLAELRAVKIRQLHDLKSVEALRKLLRLHLVAAYLKVVSAVFYQKCRSRRDQRKNNKRRQAAPASVLFALSFQFASPKCLAIV